MSGVATLNVVAVPASSTNSVFHEPGVLRFLVVPLTLALPRAGLGVNGVMGERAIKY